MARLMGPWDDPVLVHRWVHGKAFDVKLMWVDPINVVTGIYEMRVVDNWVVSFHKPTFKKPMRPGKWTIKMIFSHKGEDMVIGQTKFLVVPLSFSKGQPISSNEAVAANSGPPGGIYNANDFLIEFDREANNTEALATNAAENSRKSGEPLHDWIDNVTEYFWTVESSCIVQGKISGCEQIPQCESTSWSSITIVNQFQCNTFTPKNGLIMLISIHTASFRWRSSITRMLQTELDFTWSNYHYTI